MSVAARLESWDGIAVTSLRDRWRVPSLTIFERTGSTNDDAMLLAEAGIARGAIVLAESQQQGRGRMGRGWLTRPGSSILASILLRPERGAADPSVMPIRVGLAAAKALRDVAGVNARIKWPNDIVVPGLGKIGGILCEGASTATGSWVVAGVGLNVTQQLSDFDESVRAAATSIALAGGRVERAPIVEAILDRLRPVLVEPPPLDPESLDQISSLDALAGHEVSIDGVRAGVAVRIDPDGALRVRMQDGEQPIRSGTVRIIESSRTHPHPRARTSAESQP